MTFRFGRANKIEVSAFLIGGCGTCEGYFGKAPVASAKGSGQAVHSSLVVRHAETGEPKVSEELASILFRELNSEANSTRRWRD